MTYHKYHLKEFFPQLGNSSVDPTLTVYLPDLMVEMGRKDQKRPCLLICPGGAYVFCGDRQVAEIKKEFSFFFPKYRIDGLGWEINGSFMAHEYEIIQSGRTIVSISKEWMT